MDKNILNFHITNGYFIRAQRMKSSNGCFIEYPKSIIINNVIEPFISCYFVNDNKIKVIKELENKEGQSKEIIAPTYAIRSLIAEDIIIETVKLKLNHKLVICHDKSGNLLKDTNSLPQLLDPPNTVEDIEKEQKILDLLAKVILGLDCSLLANELDVYEGYKIIKHVFDNGGICNV